MRLLIYFYLFVASTAVWGDDPFLKIKEMAPLKRIEFVFEMFPETKGETQELLGIIHNEFIKTQSPELFEGNFFPSFSSLYKLKNEKQEEILRSILNFLNDPIHEGDFEQFVKVVRMINISAGSRDLGPESFFNQSEYEKLLLTRLSEFGEELSEKYPNENSELTSHVIEDNQWKSRNSFDNGYYGFTKQDRDKVRNIIQDYISELDIKFEHYVRQIGTTQIDPVTGESEIMTFEILKKFIDKDYISVENSHGKAKITFVGDSDTVNLQGKPIYKIELNKFQDDVFYFEHENQPTFKKFERRFLDRQQIAHNGHISFYDEDIAQGMNQIKKGFYQLTSNFKDAFFAKGTNTIYGKIDDRGIILEKLKYEEKAVQGSATWMGRYLNAKTVIPKMDNVLMGVLTGAATSASVLGIKHLTALSFGGGSHLDWKLMSVVGANYLFWSIFSKLDKNLKYDGGGLKSNILKIEFMKAIPYYMAFTYFSGGDLLDLTTYAIMMGTLFGKSASKLSWKGANDFLIATRLNNTAFKIFGTKLKSYKWSDFHEFITGLAPRLGETFGLAMAASDAVPTAYKAPLILGTFLAVHVSGAVTAKAWIGRKMKSMDKGLLSQSALAKWEKIDKTFKLYFGPFLKAGQWLKESTQRLRTRIKDIRSGNVKPSKWLQRYGKQSYRKHCNKLF